MEKQLKEIEHIKIESNHKDIKIEKLEQMLMDRDIKELNNKQEVLKLKSSLLELEKLKIQIKLERKQEKLNKLLEKSRKFHLELEEKYDLKPGWGYHPDTLILIQKEE